MRKNEEVVVEITDIGINGEGVGHFDGCALFVRDAVVGDTVRCALTKVAKTYAYARLVQVITPSPYRTRPRCPVAARCGGCQLQYYTYEAQLDLKRRKVREDLVRIGHFVPDFVDSVMKPIVGMEDPWRYRNKEQVPVGTAGTGGPEAGRRRADGGKADVVIGFYAVHSHSIVPMTDCLIGREENAEILKTILAWMRKYRVPAYDESTGKGLMRHILIRNGRISGEVMVCLVASGNSLPHASALTDALKVLPGMTSVALNENTARTNVILGSRTFTLWGEPVISDSLRILDAELVPDEGAGEGSEGRWVFRETGREVSFTISARSFYQVNPVQTEKLYSLVRMLGGFSGTGRVLDLYCGVGTISLFIADAVDKVTGIEVIPEAVEDARKNAENNGISSAEFIAGRAEEVLPGMEGSFDCIIVDPPRKGLDEVCINTILGLMPPKVIYVSCDPATLARDLAKLNAGGYEIKTVVPVDQFAHTVHVECVSLLQRMSNTRERTITLDVEMEDYHRIKNEGR
ncbi:MAG: 23S rRNA (uracil(1939)-C(5))-methyltransferase RlmD [Lachnospiraceae bacterium]|nr:23S rRNA (uracil(1939)-C(5))-methyltransferase RlmD [Lachnospiraceae bacterium]